MRKTRVEALSDGVVAIALTLLVLEIKVPEGAGQDLPHQLAEQWPSYAAHVVSFFVIGVIWTNHDALFAHIARAGRGLMPLNLVVLFSNALIRHDAFDGRRDRRALEVCRPRPPLARPQTSRTRRSGAARADSPSARRSISWPSWSPS
jgi:hypothetical protein